MILDEHQVTEKKYTSDESNGTQVRKVALVTNIPAPYRIPVLDILSAQKRVDLNVYYCSRREPDREWNLQTHKYKEVYLKERYFTYRGKFIHWNSGLAKELTLFKPSIVITTGFNPTHLVAFIYSLLNHVPHIAMTDGTWYTEQKLSWVHRLVRTIVYGKTSAFIGASKGSIQLYKNYGIADRKIFQSHLCANNALYQTHKRKDKKYDFVFSARFIAAKNPLFAIDVATQVSVLTHRKTSLLMLGSGEMLDVIKGYAEKMSDLVEVHLAGFVAQEDLPEYYSSAKILLFPTQIDTWGVVANEACAAGLPVIVTPAAGVAGELVIDNQNGFVIPLDVSSWTEAAIRLLSDPKLYADFSARSQKIVATYTYQNSATGISDAIDSISQK